MKGLEPLLALLADGAVHSGQALGEAIGVSRAAVWKQLQKLEQLGLQVNAVKGSGYQLAAPLDLLDRQQLHEQLSGRLSAALVLQVEGVTASTNQLAMAWAERAPQDGTLYLALAEQQSAGRGRRGRDWVSPFAANLYLSLAVSFSGGAAAIEGLSLAVGVAVRRALLRFGCDCELKWPNDILCGGQKLGGILLEMTGDPVGDCRVVIGVGLNVAMPAAAAGQIDQPWTDLASQLDSPPSRTELAIAVAEAIVEVTDHYQQQGFKHWRQEWQQAGAYIGEQVEIHGPGGIRSGVMVGIDESGALLLAVNGAAAERIIGGELSLRKGGSHG
jgi:BirA family biotin operon repressor/biotin-[acetyl-CoA-carboxylase] ligase